MKLLAVFCLAAVVAAAATQESRPEVQSEDPCESVQDQPCPLGKRNHCTTQDITCKCRC
ncbi:unnamed protein product, partial [Ixodes persulcatus]